MTNVGFWTRPITLASVKVLPDPVTPSNTWCGNPRSTLAASASIACGWSPAGLKSATSLNLPTATAYHRATRLDDRVGPCRIRVVEPCLRPDPRARRVVDAPPDRCHLHLLHASSFIPTEPMAHVQSPTAGLCGSDPMGVGESRMEELPAIESGGDWDQPEMGRARGPGARRRQSQFHTIDHPGLGWRYPISSGDAPRQSAGLGYVPGRNRRDRNTRRAELPGVSDGSPPDVAGPVARRKAGRTPRLGSGVLLRPLHGAGLSSPALDRCVGRPRLGFHPVADPESLCHHGGPHGGSVDPLRLAQTLVRVNQLRGEHK